MTSISIYQKIAQPIPVTQSKTDIFINKARIIHGDLYNYDSVEYITNKIKVKITCKVHGEFEQQPTNHLSGKGCNLCARIIVAKLQSSNTNEFIEKANIIHADMYNYGLVEYINARTRIKIKCNIHGIFEQTPHVHLHKHGCPKCSKNVSKISNKWLESLNIKDLIFEYRLPENKRKPVDAYSPFTNTVYQFHGDYWHGGNNSRFVENNVHPTMKKTYGELYKKTIESDNWIQSLDYNLVTMWESDFK